MYLRRLGIAVVGVALLSCLGCGSGYDLPDLGYVKGTVTMDGQPLADALVTFQPEAGRPSFGRTDANGKYELVFNRDAEGAEVGKHTVTITTENEGDEDAGGGSTAEKVPSQYNSETTLSEDVAAGKNTIDFELSSEGEIKVESES